MLFGKNSADSINGLLLHPVEVLVRATLCKTMEDIKLAEVQAVGFSRPRKKEEAVMVVFWPTLRNNFPVDGLCCFGINTLQGSGLLQLFS